MFTKWCDSVRALSLPSGVSTGLSVIMSLSDDIVDNVHICQANIKSSCTIVGLCMLMSFSIHLHGLHLDAQYGQT